jgi:hypothetical protein
MFAKLSSGARELPGLVKGGLARVLSAGSSAAKALEGAYANPAKVWRRLGCAPYTFDGKTQMPSTWRGGRSGKLPASEWEACGYSPRRRSIAYLVGDLIVKANKLKQAGAGGVGVDAEELAARPGPYRVRYDEAKAAVAALHPDYPKQRCHYHGMLLATKRLLRELWRAWRDCWGEGDADTDIARATPVPPPPPEVAEVPRTPRRRSAKIAAPPRQGLPAAAGV